jgi:hypothetical protein
MTDRVVQDDAHVFEWALCQVEQKRNADMDYNQDWTADDYWEWTGECDSEVFADV